MTNKMALLAMRWYYLGMAPSNPPFRTIRLTCGESKDILLINPIPLHQQHDDGIVVAMWFVYLVRCADGTLYVGRTTNLASREKAHSDGTGAAYTAARRPVQVVYAEEHG
jgi:GIY-YIG catalytic domain